MSCEVCMENFTIALRRKINCSFCDYSACSQCHQRYLLGSSEYAHCMSCRKGWTREILHREFTDAFVNKAYKQQRENVLYERERSLMPETQPYVELARRVMVYTDQQSAFRAERDNLTRLAHQTNGADLNFMGKETWDDARIERFRRVTEINKQVAALSHDISFIEFAVNVLRSTNPSTEKRKFVRACPANGCHGFLSTAWKCGLCEVKVCSKCHDIKGENEDEHMCDPNNVATAEMLSRDSKTCPKCAAMIFKIAGCDQMYCTQCHTAFSWRTGRVEQGAIHNPHYYEYMRQNGTLQRNPGDVLCGGLPTFAIFQHALRFRNSYTEPQRLVLHGKYQNIVHIQHGGIMHRYRETGVLEGRDLRIKFMLGTISEDEFKRKLQQREKSENKKREIREVLEMYTTVCTDIFQRIVQTPHDNLYEETVTIQQHTAQLLVSISMRWKCATPNFNEYGTIV